MNQLAEDSRKMKNVPPLDVQQPSPGYVTQKWGDRSLIRIGILMSHGYFDVAKRKALRNVRQIHRESLLAEKSMFQDPMQQR